MEIVAVLACIIICSLSIKKSNQNARKAQAILEDIEAHHKFLIAVAAKDNRRSRWRSK